MYGDMQHIGPEWAWKYTVLMYVCIASINAQDAVITKGWKYLLKKDRY